MPTQLLEMPIFFNYTHSLEKTYSYRSILFSVVLVETHQYVRFFRAIQWRIIIMNNHRWEPKKKNERTNNNNRKSPVHKQNGEWRMEKKNMPHMRTRRRTNSHCFCNIPNSFLIGWYLAYGATGGHCFSNMYSLSKINLQPLFVMNFAMKNGFSFFFLSRYYYYTRCLFWFGPGFYLFKVFFPRSCLQLCSAANRKRAIDFMPV